MRIRRRYMSVVRAAIAVFLAFLFATSMPVSYCAQTPTPTSRNAGRIEDQVRQLPIDAYIEVRFTDKTKLRGYLATVEADGFSFKEGSSASPTLRQAPFSDVESVKVITKTHTPAGAWIAVGAIVAVAVIVGVLVAERAHNEGAL
jgi:hypothetical protein